MEELAGGKDQESKPVAPSKVIVSDPKKTIKNPKTTFQKNIQKKIKNPQTLNYLAFALFTVCIMFAQYINHIVDVLSHIVKMDSFHNKNIPRR